jgi:hypothetical protein
MRMILLRLLLISWFSIILGLKLLAQNIPEAFKLPIIFIAVKDNKGKLNYNGTGFFVSVPLDSAHYWLYLVTAKHVITDEADNRLYDSIWVRVNGFKNSSYVFPITIFDRGPLQDVDFHSDPSVDLAVITVVSTSTDLDYIPIGDSHLFKSRKDFDSSYVKEGTDIFYTGMFTSYLGYRRNVPIVRFGKVSLITDEKLLWDSAKNELSDLFLVETTTFGGNSGSPVFSYEVPFSLGLQNPRNTSKDSIMMIGVIKGSYLENMPIGFKETSSMIPTYTSNVGISGVIPSYLLYEILHGARLETERNKYLRNQNLIKSKQ